MITQFPPGSRFNRKKNVINSIWNVSFSFRDEIQTVSQRHEFNNKCNVYYRDSGFVQPVLYTLTFLRYIFTLLAFEFRKCFMNKPVSIRNNKMSQLPGENNIIYTHV